MTIKRPVLSLVVASLLFTACASSTTSPIVQPSSDIPAGSPTTGASPGESPSTGDVTYDEQATFVWGAQGEPGSLDPAIVNIDWEMTVEREINESLTTYDTSTYELKPNLATEWTAVDPQTWEFKLRPNVTFHGGQPFTGDDVKASFDRMLKIGEGQVYLIEQVDQVTVVDPLTVQIHTKTPQSRLPEDIVHTGIISAQDLAANAGSDDGRTWFRDHPNGTGPYTFVKWDPGVSITLQKNESWWGTPAQGSPATVIVKFVEDAATMVQGLQSGEITMAAAVPVADAVRIGNSPGFTLLAQNGGFGTVFYNLNMSIEPTNNLLFRKALTEALDYQALLDAYKGFASTPSGPLPPWVADSPAEDFPPFERDLDQAKADLEASGVATREISCLVPAGDPDLAIGATVIQASMQAIGVTVNLLTEPWDQAIKDMADHKAQCFLIGAANVSPDSTLFFDSHFVTGAVYNLSEYAEPAFDELNLKIKSTFDAAERQTMMHEAYQMIRDSYQIIYGVLSKNLYPAPNYVQGFQRDPFDYTPVRFQELSMLQR